jgi:hypothetical protein
MTRHGIALGVGLGWLGACTPGAVTIGLEPSGTAGGSGTAADTETGDIGPMPEPPVVLFVDVEQGPVDGEGPDGLGVPITIYGTGFGAAQGASVVRIGGVDVARVLQWGQPAANPAIDTITVLPGPAIAGGAIEVVVDGDASASSASFVANDARVLEVAPGGDDANPCTTAAPCATMRHVMASVATAGDTVLVHDRVNQAIDDEILWEAAGGTPDRPIVLKAYPGERVVLDDSDRPMIFGAAAAHITVAGFDLRNGKSVSLGTGTGRRVIDCSFAATEGIGEAIAISGDAVRVAGCHCELLGDLGDGVGHCVAVRGPADGVEILYSSSIASEENGIHIYDDQVEGPPGPIANVLVEGNRISGSRVGHGISASTAIVAIGLHGVIIRNNLAFANAHAGIAVGGIDGADVVGLRVWANTVYDNGRQGIHVDGVADVDVRGNLIVDTDNERCIDDECAALPRAHIAVAGGVAIDVEGNFYAPGPPVMVGATELDPSSGTVTFADPVEGDLRPVSGGVIDTADTLSGAVLDVRGLPRPRGAGYDFGAYEQ